MHFDSRCFDLQNELEFTAVRFPSAKLQNFFSIFRVRVLVRASVSVFTLHDSPFFFPFSFLRGTWARQHVACARALDYVPSWWILLQTSPERRSFVPGLLAPSVQRARSTREYNVILSLLSRYLITLVLIQPYNMTFQMHELLPLIGYIKASLILFLRTFRYVLLDYV